MFSEIMSLALGNGLWAALFCLLFMYQLKDSRAREKKYSAALKSLSDSLGTVKNIKADCAVISGTLTEVKTDCKAIKTDCSFIKGRIRAVKKTNERVKKPAQKEASIEL